MHSSWEKLGGLSWHLALAHSQKTDLAAGVNLGPSEGRKGLKWLVCCTNTAIEAWAGCW